MSEPTATAPTPPQPFTPPKDRLGLNYYKLFTASAVSNLGDGIGQIAYPWLASAITRNPLLIALVAVAQRLPWLVFSLPAGVLTDRLDRRKAMIAMDLLRGLLTVGVAIGVLAQQGVLPSPDQLDRVVSTNMALYLVVLMATLLLGMAEVLRDNSAQTIMPSIVHHDQLEKGNGRMWSAELIGNTFAGPPLASALLIVAFSLPFFVDAATFFVASALVFLIPGSFRTVTVPDAPKRTFKQDLSEGMKWLMAHPLLRPMAIILGLLNGSAQIFYATFVLFAQEVMGIGPTLFAVIGFGGAIGGVIGGQVASRISKRLGSGKSLAVALGGLMVIPFLIGVFPYWPVVLGLFAIESFLGVLWNVITVSLRQTIIPDNLLGRVNSVYRFFAWGMMPIGAAVGGVLVFVVEPLIDRDWALRSTWFAAGIVQVGLFVFGRSKLTTEKIEAARLAAATPQT